MARAKHLYDGTSVLKEEIGRLKAELYDTRMDLIDAMPSNISPILKKWARSKTSDEAIDCEIEAINTIVESAVPNPEFNNWKHEKRAACPLCKDTGRHWSYGADGFSLPDGLKRHLRGDSGAYKCSIIRTIETMHKYES